MIYFVRSVDRSRIKIGTTACLAQRLKRLATEHGEGLDVLAVAEGSYEAEEELHQRFSHLRLDGEWFEPGDDLLGFIASEGSPWDSSREGVQVRIDSDLATMAKYVAARKGLKVLDLLSEIIRPTLEREFKKVAPKIGDGEE